MFHLRHWGWIWRGSVFSNWMSSCFFLFFLWNQIMSAVCFRLDLVRVQLQKAALHWDRLMMVLFLYLSGLIWIRKNEYWWWWWIVSDEIYVRSFSGRASVFYLSHCLLSWAVIHYLSRKPDLTQTVSRNMIRQLGLMIKTWKTWSKEKQFSTALLAILWGCKATFCECFNKSVHI